MDAPPPKKKHPLAEAIEWVSRILAVALLMLLPAWGGSKLDEWLGTGYWVLVGLVLGFVIGGVHLLVMTGAIGGKKRR